MAGRIAADETWEVKDGGMGGWGFVIGLLAVHVVYTSQIATRIFFNHQGHEGHKDEAMDLLPSLCSL